MRIFYILLFLLLTEILPAQVRSFDFVIDNIVFNVKRTEGKVENHYIVGLVELCTFAKIKPSGFPDTSKKQKDTTICELLNNDDAAILVSTIKKHLEKILGAPYTNSEKTITSVVETKVGELYKSLEYSEFEFGKDLYFGLNDSEIEQLYKLHKELNDLYSDFTKKKILYNKAVNLTESDYEKNEFNKKIETKLIEKKPKLLDTLSDLYLSIKSAKAEIISLRRKRKYQAYLIGNANTISSFKTLDKSELNAGFGIRAYKPAHAEFLGVLTVAQVRDTIKGVTEDFGESVLVPGVRKFSFLASFRLNNFDETARSHFFRKIGCAANINVTPYNWLLKKISDPAVDSVSGKAIPAALDFFITYNWLKIYEDGKDISISTDIGLATRILAGNLTKDERQKFLGIDDRAFIGINIGTYIRYNALRVQFYAPFIFANKVNGLTHGQVYASIGFIGSILNDARVTDKYKRKENAVAPVF